MKAMIGDLIPRGLISLGAAMIIWGLWWAIGPLPGFLIAAGVVVGVLGLILTAA